MVRHKCRNTYTDVGEDGIEDGLELGIREAEELTARG